MLSQVSASNILITGGNFYQSNKTSKDPFERLLEATAPAAFHDSDDVHDPPKCHPNTRVAILNKIMDWIHGADPETRNALIMWLYGPAGSGKSAIARSIAELCAKEGVLVASYFFSRFDSTRNHCRSLIATIAYQASLCFPDIRDRMIGTIEHDPLIFARSLDSQIFSLIVEPLQERIGSGYFNATTPARVVIIDGLDECEDRNSQVKVLEAISKSLHHHRLPFLFLITSRPEPDIRGAFDFGYLSQVSTRNPLDDNYLPSEDILRFLRDKFSEIEDFHPFRAQIPPAWPPEDALQILVDKSSGQFIYASTVVKFVKSTRHRPPQRLEIILGIRPVQHERPFAELDALYMHILSSVANLEAAVQILALQLLSKYPFKVNKMEILLSLDTGDIPILLCDLTSLVSVDESESFGNPGTVLRVFHASLGDFLFDQSRSKQFWINAPLRHAEFAVLYLQDLTRVKTYDDFHNLRFHIQGAAPTRELQEKVVESSLASYLVEKGASSFIPDFFATISQWNIDGAIDLYIEQLQCFDHSAKGILETMYTDSRLTSLVSILKLEVMISHSRNTDILLELFSLSNTQHLLDKLSFSHSAHLSPNYRLFILEFFEDPSRCGIYTLTSERYATAAVYFLNCISNHLEQIIPYPSTDERKYMQQRNTPWLWRKILQKIPSSEATQIARWQALKNQRRLKLYRGSSNMLKSDRAFGLALRCLVHVLPQAAISEELTVLASQHTFGPLLRKRPNRKRAVKQEIARYLARAEQERS
ncbi:hypothetical protein GALMADRAFT_249682 [Galerina marginata CBS 339.88]|uniref:Nephrocystin 3-like N-terminal domain-containing protein n=1 Tax=Galerina marginata (strain CBS 339.88) TaxID=685588 RepID=A0A067SXK2_GALM3|nr:hypothetical protein GALMADRAFT_249682 [Galerina marginata CBS 339.88]